MVIMRTIDVCRKHTNQIAITMTTWTETCKWAVGLARLTMCRTAGFALKLNIAHDYAMPALQTDIDRDLNTLHHCLGAA